MIRNAGLPGSVADRAVAVFTRLGEAEALEHAVPLESVHFHEVGAADAIADIVGVCLGLHLLGVDHLVSSPFLFGRGRARMAHGTWPVPAPATVRLTLGHPVRFEDLDGETVTPTGAALIVALADSIGWFPAMSLEAAGAGAGSREWPDRPNVLRGYLGTSADLRTGRDEVDVLTTTLDDMTPELTGAISELLMTSGALDVTLTPVQMKKGRPGIRIEILCPPDRAESIAFLLFRETPTIGIRRRREERWILARTAGTVRLHGGAVAVKVVTLPDGTRRLKPEFEDCRRISRETGIPLLEIMRQAGESELSAE